MSRPLPLALEDRKCWRVYESKARRASLEYKTHPLSPVGKGGQKCTAGCGRRTYRLEGVCVVCEAKR